jgi:hypothetical protein
MGLSARTRETTGHCSNAGGLRTVDDMHYTRSADDRYFRRKSAMRRIVTADESVPCEDFIRQIEFGEFALGRAVPIAPGHSSFDASLTHAVRQVLAVDAERRRERGSMRGSSCRSGRPRYPEMA